MPWLTSGNTDICRRCEVDHPSKSTFYVVDFNVPYVIVLNLLNRKVLPMFVYFEVIILILKTFKVTRIESVQ